MGTTFGETCNGPCHGNTNTDTDVKNHPTRRDGQVVKITSTTRAHEEDDVFSDPDSTSDPSDNEQLMSDVDEVMSSLEEVLSSDIDEVLASPVDALKTFKKALLEGNHDLVMYLAEEHSNMNLLRTVLQDGDSCLHVAVRNKKYETILYLLTNGIDPNVQNPRCGDTVLHVAVNNGDKKLVAMLLRFNADANIRNKHGRTPMTIAMQREDQSIAGMLLLEGAVVVSSSKPAMRQSSILSQRKSKSKLPEMVEDVKEVAADRDDDESNEEPLMKKQSTHAMLADVKADLSTIQQLATLEGWLEKRSGFSHSWKRRWVVVKDSHILWSNVQMTIDDAKDEAQRAKFKKCLNLMSIADIEAAPKSKHKEVFRFVVGQGVKRSPRRKKGYAWRCNSETERDHWVSELKKRQTLIQSFTNYLSAD